MDEMETMEELEDCGGATGGEFGIGGGLVVDGESVEGDGSAADD